MGRASDPLKARVAAHQVVHTLRGAGFVAYFAGGCVRDELLGLSPTDYDIATDARPDDISKLFERTLLVGLAFGVLLVHVDQCQIEVATFRSDGPYSDARRPDSIHFSDARSDAARRDFTINALFLDPLAEPESPRPGMAQVQGHIIDYVGGTADLLARRIRAVGDPDQRLAEDHLRALRAVRFAARLGFDMDVATADAIGRHAMELRGVSRERIGEELRRMMTHPSRSDAASLLQRLGLDAPVLDEPAIQLPPSTLEGLGRVASPLFRSAVRYGTALAAWLIDRVLATQPAPAPDELPWHLGKGAAQQRGEIVSRLRRALCLSNDERDDMLEVLEGLGLLLFAWESRAVAGQKRIVARRWFREALRLVFVLDPPLASRIESRVGELQATPTGIAPEPFVTGDDLIAIGMRPSPKFRSVLDRVLDAQLEGRVSSKVEAMELARQLGV